MVVIGAGGLASEILETLLEQYKSSEIFFFDDINQFETKYLFEEFPILTTLEDVKLHFDKTGDYKFCIGFGGINHKINLVDEFKSFGGELTSVISSLAYVSSYNVSIGEGVIIMPGVKISNNVEIGKCSLIYYNSVITHDCIIGNYCEISPSVNLLGRCEIKNEVFVGANATILPDVIVSNNATIGAGSVVTKDVNINTTVIGIPAKLKK